MLPEKMENALNVQINKELYSSYLYLSMATYFQGNGLSGFAAWMKAQAQEELFHAVKFFNFVGERGGNVVLEEIAKPPATWKSPLTAFHAVLEHEQYVTSLINGLVDLAIAERDHATNTFLQWFVSEQVEEEDSVSDIINKLKLIGKEQGSLFLLDQELGRRVFTPPTTAA